MPGAVLFVDDAASIRRFWKETFELDGFDVRLALDGEMAMSIMVDQPVDVVVLDSTLPGMCGAEFFARIRADWPALPVIVYSTELIQDAWPSRLERPNRWILKSDEPSTLREAVHELAAQFRSDRRNIDESAAVCIWRNLSAACG